MKLFFKTALVVVFFLFAPFLSAQRLAVGFNDQPAGGLPLTNTDPSLQAFKYTVTRTMVAVAAEFWVGASTGTGTVAIFANNSANQPGNLLGMGTFSAPPVWCWAGAMFNKPILLQANQVVWLCFGMSARYRTPAAGRSPTAPTYFWTKSAGPTYTWNGPYGPPKQSTGFTWMYRLYEGAGSGKFISFGTGKAGTHGVIKFSSRGWPNRSNPFTLIATNMRGQSPGILVWGRKTNIPLPVGSVYSFPPLVTEPFSTGGTTATPEAKIFTYKLPGDPALFGLSLVWQIWLLDSGAKDSLANTAGLEGIIG